MKDTKRIWRVFKVFEVFKTQIGKSKKFKNQLSHITSIIRNKILRSPLKSDSVDWQSQMDSYRVTFYYESTCITFELTPYLDILGLTFRHILSTR